LVCQLEAAQRQRLCIGSHRWFADP
jgi:hypothetical protein